MTLTLTLTLALAPASTPLSSSLPLSIESFDQKEDPEKEYEESSNERNGSKEELTVSYMTLIECSEMEALPLPLALASVLIDATSTSSLYDQKEEDPTTSAPAQVPRSLQLQPLSLLQSDESVQQASALALVLAPIEILSRDVVTIEKLPRKDPEPLPMLLPPKIKSLLNWEYKFIDNFTSTIENFNSVRPNISNNLTPQVSTTTQPSGNDKYQTYIFSY